MVAGLAFLSKKGFNPANQSNQKAVWEARQRKEQEIRRAKEREDQLRRERDDEELARARGGTRGGDQAALGFMYGPPPGLSATSAESKVTTPVEAAPATSTETARLDLTQRQPGDDDAAAAFRQMLAAASAPSQEKSATASSNSADSSSLSGAALSGTSIEAPGKSEKDDEALSALEKAVGRKDANRSLTLDEQVARFPQLRNAPMAKGMSGTNVNVTFKPLGTQLRNIRCLACGVWGHSRGDRECQVSGWNPFGTERTARDSTRVQSEIAEPPDATDESASDHKRKREFKQEDTRGSCSSDEEEELHRRRKKRSKKHKLSSRHRKDESRRHRRRSRSFSPESRRSRKKSHKRQRKHSSRYD